MKAPSSISFHSMQTGNPVMLMDSTTIPSTITSTSTSTMTRTVMSASNSPLVQPQHLNTEPPETITITTTIPPSTTSTTTHILTIPQTTPSSFSSRTCRPTPQSYPLPSTSASDTTVYTAIYPSTSAITTTPLSPQPLGTPSSFPLTSTSTWTSTLLPPTTPSTTSTSTTVTSVFSSTGSNDTAAATSLAPEQTAGSSRLVPPHAFAFPLLWTLDVLWWVSTAGGDSAEEREAVRDGGDRVSDVTGRAKRGLKEKAKRTEKRKGNEGPGVMVWAFGGLGVLGVMAAVAGEAW